MKNHWLPRVLKRTARIGMRLVLAFVGFSIALVVAFRWFDPPGSSFMIQARAKGIPVHRHWVELEAIAPSLQLAVIASEDQRFPDHYGVDPRAISKAIQEHMAGGELRGASTITQQTAKNLFLWGGRSFVRKAMEAWFAILIDGLWPKRRILEVYLNVAEFGEGVYGAHAASAVYFGKTPGKLTKPEAALLAAVLPNPKAMSVREPSDHVRRRQAWILRQMRLLGGAAYLRKLK